MPLIKTSGLTMGMSKFLGKGLFNLGKGIITKGAIPMATGAVKGVAHGAGFLGKQIVKHPTAAAGIGFGAFGAYDMANRHFGQTWDIQRNMPYRYF